MKPVYALVSFFNGCLFLLVSLVFYSDITRLLTSVDEQAGWDTPSFWDLALVLRIVRVIFIVVGGLLVSFGIGATVLWLKRPPPGDTSGGGTGWISRFMRRLTPRR
jgi:hypothetical protein